MPSEISQSQRRKNTVRSQGDGGSRGSQVSVERGQSILLGRWEAMEMSCGAIRPRGMGSVSPNWTQTDGEGGTFRGMCVLPQLRKKTLRSPVAQIIGGLAGHRDMGLGTVVCVERKDREVPQTAGRRPQAGQGLGTHSG